MFSITEHRMCYGKYLIWCIERYLANRKINITKRRVLGGSPFGYINNLILKFILSTTVH